jgi:prophage regulatory protein
MDKILRLPEVLARVGLKKTSLYEQIEGGHFPKAIPLTVDGRAVGWRESEISRWIEQRAKQASYLLQERKQHRQALAA